MPRKQVRFTLRQIAAIQTEARRRRTSDAAVVRQAADQLLGGSKSATTGAESVACALATVGRFASRRPDISREHDRELAMTDLAFLARAKDLQDRAKWLFAAQRGFAEIAEGTMRDWRQFASEVRTRLRP